MSGVLSREARRAGRVTGFVALTGAMLPAFLARTRLAPEGTRDAIRRRWVGAWADALLGLFGVEAEVRGVLPPAGRTGRLVVANHRSSADILLLLRTFLGRMVSRGDLAGWPLVGQAAQAAGTLFVDRSDAVSGATAVRTIRTRLVAGDTIIVFPEGTTFADDVVRPFHAGAFVAAMGSGADVVPVGLAYRTGSGAAFIHESFGAHLARMAAAPGTSRVVLELGAPIAAAAHPRAASLRDAAHAEVARLVAVARAAVDAPR